MRVWRHASVRTKLMVVAMATSVAALLMAAGGIVSYELQSARRTLTSRLDSVASLTGATSTAAIQFGDRRVAGETLSVLSRDPDFEAARLDLVDGTHFASHVRKPSVIPERLPVEFAGVVGGSVVVSRAVMLDGRVIGAIRLQGGLDAAYAPLRQYLVILVAVLAASSLVAYLLSSGLQRVISGPILRLANTASTVSDQRDYALRARKESDDEIGLLVDRFNEMLAQIERRDAAINEARHELEARVRDRTHTLQLEIDERRRTENQLIVAKAAAEEASVAKSAFLANMSHELRTPLNAIIGYSEMLIEDAADRGQDAAVHDLEKIVGAGRHLLALITDVLDLSKIEAGRMELDLERFDVADVIRAAVATSQTLAAAHGNSLTAASVDGLGIVRADRTKVQQVLLNLLSNACKFTKSGWVTVDARREASPAGDQILIDVSDNGLGMTPEQTARLFREFTQADASTTRKFGGTGLGLAISQRLCQLMGGVLTVDSEFGRGSRFTVKLPAEVGDSVTRTGKLARPVPGGASGARPAAPALATSGGRHAN
jgi:signal transduction histidine kinase